jgi:CRP/FNR family transcriptional regulator, cyclic AMP receptor protein
MSDRHGWIDERLAEVPLFKGLSKKQLRQISSLAMRIDGEPGKVLTKEGEIGYEFIVVLEGEVEVREGDKVIAKRGPGDYFGEIALLDKRPRTATVVATTPVVIEVIPRREFVTLLKDVPEINEHVLATMAERLAELDGPKSS